jgi:hypothetical protein
MRAECGIYDALFVLGSDRRISVMTARTKISHDMNGDAVVVVAVRVLE